MASYRNGKIVGINFAEIRDDKVVFVDAPYEEVPDTFKVFAMEDTTGINPLADVKEFIF